MTIKFYTDTHIHKAVTAQLRNRSVDIVRCEEVNMALALDLEHLAYAANEGRSIVTNDQGFAAWHEQWLEQGKSHAGLFLITHDKDDIGMIIRTLYFWHEAAVAGAIDVEHEVYNQIIRIPWR